MGSNEGSEVCLVGGNDSEVVRVGSTVRRTSRPWSPAVRWFLEHLHAQGFDGAPRFLRVDERGRDVLTFMEGDVGNYPLTAAMTSDVALQNSADLVRQFHLAQKLDVTEIAALPWRNQYDDPERWEVICHNDIAPYNLVYSDGVPSSMIDFDNAGPGPRVWDVAHAAYRLVPLSSDAHCQVFGWQTMPDRPRRLQMFIDRYGLLTSGDKRELLDSVVTQLSQFRNSILERAALGDPGVATQVRENHAASYEADLNFIDQERANWQRAIS